VFCRLSWYNFFQLRFVLVLRVETTTDVCFRVFVFGRFWCRWRSVIVGLFLGFVIRTGKRRKRGGARKKKKGWRVLGEEVRETTWEMDLFSGIRDMERYEMVRDIGSGNFAVAKLMRDKKTRELVAVKYIERGEKVRDLIIHVYCRGIHVFVSFPFSFLFGGLSCFFRVSEPLCLWVLRMKAGENFDSCRTFVFLFALACFQNVLGTCLHSLVGFWWVYDFRLWLFFLLFSFAPDWWKCAKRDHQSQVAAASKHSSFQRGTLYPSQKDFFAHFGEIKEETFRAEASIGIPPLWFVVDLDIIRTVNRLSHLCNLRRISLTLSLSLSLSCRFCSPPLTWLSLWSTQLEVRFLKGFAMLAASVRMRSVSLYIKSSLKKKDGLVWRM